MRNKLTIILGLGLYLTGCGNTPRNTASSVAAPTTTTVLDGKWESNCVDKTKIFLDNADGEQMRIFRVYHDDECEFLAMTLISNKSFSIPTEGKLDYVFNTASLTPHTQVQVDYFNDEKIYGINSWRINGTVDITGKYGFGALIEHGQKSYQIYKFEGDRLYLGQLEDDGSLTEATRPTIFDEAMYFVKQ